MAHGHFAVAQVGLLNDARAGRGDPRAGDGDVLHLQDHHVAAVAAALFEEPAGGRALLLRRHHFEESLANREDRVLQAELAHARIIIGVVEAEDGADVRLAGGEVAADEGDLAKAHGPGSL